MRQSLEILRDIPIGGTVELDGLRLQCRKVINCNNGCLDCYFDKKRMPMPFYPEQCAVMRYCMSARRSDHVSVNYVEIGKTEED